MRIFALIISAFLFVLFIFVAVLAYQAADMRSVGIAGGTALFGAGFFAYQWLQLRRERGN